MPMRTLLAAHDAARAQFDKLEDTSRQMSLVGNGLVSLAKLGNLVDPDDVVREASKLVAGGIDPHQLATMMAQMPQVGGEPMQAWLQGQAQALAQAQAQIAPLHEAARHQLGVAALGVLMGHHMGLPGGGGNGQVLTGPSNDLTTPSPGAGPSTGPGSNAPSPPANPLELMNPQGRA